MGEESTGEAGTKPGIEKWINLLTNRPCSFISLFVLRRQFSEHMFLLF